MTALSFASSLQSSSFPPAGMGLESSPFVNYSTIAALFFAFALFVRIAAREEEAAAAQAEEATILRSEKKEDESKKKKKKTAQHQLVTADGVALRLAAGSLFLGLRAKNLELRSAGAGFPPAQDTITMEAPVAVQLLSIAGLLALAGFLVRSAKKDAEQHRAEEDAAEKQEEKEDAKETEKKKQNIELVTFDGIALKLACGLLFFAAREMWSPAIAAVRAACSAAAFPPPMATVETPASVCLLSLAGLCFGFTALVRGSNAELQEEEKEEKEEETEEKEPVPEQHQIISADGTALRLGVCLGLFGVCEAVRENLPALRAAIKAMRSVSSFPPQGVAMETPTSVCLLSLAVLCFCFTAAIRSSQEDSKEEAEEEGEETKEKEVCEKPRAPQQHQIVSVDGTALRIGVCCGLFGAYDAARSTGLLSAVRTGIRGAFSATSFPPRSATLETPASVCLLSLAVLCFGFAAVIRSSREDSKEAKEEETKEKKACEKKQHQIVSADGTAVRLGVCCGLFGVYQAASTSLLPALRAAIGSDELAMGGGMLLFGTGLLLAENRSSSVKKVA